LAATDPIYQRTLDEKLAYIQGVRAGVELASKLAVIYEGQSDLAGRITRAGYGMADVMQSTSVGHPCAVCGYDNACGEPPGEDCHS